VYTSNESGQGEVYVQDFPGPGRKWRVSTEGGMEPAWSADGRTIFYLSSEGLMAVDVASNEPLRLGTPRLVFEIQPAPVRSTRRYDLSPDGRRFLFLLPEGVAAVPPLTVHANWSRRLAP
jgi:Tol biopolymer transport system component